MTKLPILLLLTCTLTAQTTEEIRQKAEQSGLSETQIRELAKQRGLTEQQIESVLNRYKKKQEQEAEPPSQTGQEILDLVPPGPEDVSVEEQELTDLEELLQAEEIEEEEVLPEKKPQPVKKPLDYYGYSIFGRDPALFQASVFGAIDPEYTIGPGDQIILLVWGETEFRQEFVVDREGFIFIPQLGQVFVNGLMLDDLESKLKKLLSRVHRTLRPDDGKRPTTFMDVTLGDLRPLRILVLGEVSQPGAYTVNSSTTLFSSLYYFNGPTKLGSLRDIRLVRNGQTVTSVDFYEYLLTGEKVDDVRLRLDDVVFIPVRGKTVSIEGEVKRPAIYELKRGEELKDLIELCGGLNTSAYLERIQVDRVVDFDKRKELGMDRMLVDVDLQEVLKSEDDFKLQDGDKIQVFSVLDIRKNVIQISGQVERPGTYDVGNSIKLRELLEKSGGLIGDAYMGQANIVRLRPDLTEELLRVDIGRALEGDPDHDITLQAFDRVQVFNTNTVFNLFKPVWVRGSVKNPGRYSYYPGMTIRDLILTSGGLSESVYRFKLQVARVDPYSPDPDRYAEIASLNLDDYYSIQDIQQELPKKDDFSLQPYDILFVRADPYFNLQKQVTVSGPVLYPGAYTILSPDEKVTEILNRAGGLRPEAYPEASRFIRGGKTIKVSFEKILDNPSSDLNFKVLDGDQIAIATKPNVVSVAGEVNAPGLYKYLPGASVRKYVQMAGGYTPEANKGQVWVEYPGGTSAKLRWFLPGPQVEDGSMITVGREEETEPIDKTALAKEIASILGSLATTFFVISRL